MILVIAEQRDGGLNRASWEVIVAAQVLAASTGQSIAVAILGSDLQPLAEELATAAVREILVAENAALSAYTADGFVEAVSQIIASEHPEVVLFPHTYQTRDYAPQLTTRLERSLVTDCIGAKASSGGVVFTRPMFQGKFVADIVIDGDAPHFASFQVGAFRADAVVRGDTAAPIRAVDVGIDPDRIRQRPEAPFKEAKQAVDLTQASRIVAVGRGIKSQEHLPLAQDLAKALDAEVAASRPICDSGWLPMDRQIGSSGQTVAPHLYLALGISGAIQHLVGMKGARTIVAINKDADAPIFEVADYGIVGDLFEIVPALTTALGAPGA
jgi:electron transfer flavoprotein alpha subunit